MGLIRKSLFGRELMAKIGQRLKGKQRALQVRVVHRHLLEVRSQSSFKIPFRELLSIMNTTTCVAHLDSQITPGGVSPWRHAEASSDFELLWGNTLGGTNDRLVCTVSRSHRRIHR